MCQLIASAEASHGDREELQRTQKNAVGTSTVHLSYFQESIRAFSGPTLSNEDSLLV